MSVVLDESFAGASASLTTIGFTNEIDEDSADLERNGSGACKPGGNVLDSKILFSYDTAPGTADQSAFFAMSSIASAGSRLAGVAIGYDPATGDGYAVQYSNNAGGSLRLGRLDADVWTTIATATDEELDVTGTEIEIRRSGSTISLHHSSTEQASVTDSNHTHVGKFAILGGNFAQGNGDWTTDYLMDYVRFEDTASAGATITSVNSGSAVTEGDTVSVVGTGFGGTEGTVRIQGVAVAAGDVTSWTDTGCDVTVPPVVATRNTTAPATALMTVEPDGGSESSTFEFELYSSDNWLGDIDESQQTETILHMTGAGLDRIDAAGDGAGDLPLTLVGSPTTGQTALHPDSALNDAVTFGAGQHADRAHDAALALSAMGVACRFEQTTVSNEVIWAKCATGWPGGGTPAAGDMILEARDDGSIRLTVYDGTQDRQRSSPAGYYVANQSVAVLVKADGSGVQLNVDANDVDSPVTTYTGGWSSNTRNLRLGGAP